MGSSVGHKIIINYNQIATTIHPSFPVTQFPMCPLKQSERERKKEREREREREINVTPAKQKAVLFAVRVLALMNSFSANIYPFGIRF